uniref:Uncharacterized protein n=1 Tax=Sus scrofa TaxID=9823 RepID=A0A8D0JVQ3_PIG
MTMITSSPSISTLKNNIPPAPAFREENKQMKQGKGARIKSSPRGRYPESSLPRGGPCRTAGPPELSGCPAGSESRLACRGAENAMEAQGMAQMAASASALSSRPCAEPRSPPSVSSVSPAPDAQSLCRYHPTERPGHLSDTASVPAKRRSHLSCFFFFFLFRATPWHMEVPRLGVKLELQLLAYTTPTATRDPSRVRDPHHSSRQHWILNALSEARDRTRLLMDASGVRNLLSHRRNSPHSSSLDTASWSLLLSYFGKRHPSPPLLTSTWHLFSLTCSPETFLGHKGTLATQVTSLLPLMSVQGPEKLTVLEDGAGGERELRVVLRFAGVQGFCLPERHAGGQQEFL